MSFKRGYCPNCDAVSDLEVRTVDQTFPVRGEPVTVTAPVAFCTTCGEDVFDRELDFAALEMAYAEYRRRKGLPGPAEIAALRERLGLSRKALAEILGCGEDAVRRYELGAVPPPEHGEVLRRLASAGGTGKPAAGAAGPSPPEVV